MHIATYFFAIPTFPTCHGTLSILFRIRVQTHAVWTYAFFNGNFRYSELVFSQHKKEHILQKPNKTEQKPTHQKAPFGNPCAR